VGPVSNLNAEATVPLIPGLHSSRVLLGCDYNPEQWAPEVWTDDVRLMSEIGVDIVAINIFGWAHVERRRGEYDFAALDGVIDLLHNAGIRLNLGTGTSSPPPWLSLESPEILPTSAEGVTAWPGGRQAWCPSSPVFRTRALALVEQTVQRYGNHPALALWHVSNELGCHNALCYCDASAEAFRLWLRERYGSLDSLNASWGTAFWSQRYGSWAEVMPPRATRSARNPAQLVDYRRFSSFALLDYYRAEADVLRQHSAVPITTNLMVTAHITTQDYWSWADDLAVIANDHYLDHRLDDPLAELAFSADLTRGLAAGGPWMLMETSPSAVSWQPVNVAKTDGEFLRTALAQVARGADSICYFQWRQSQRGAERFHSALLPHGGVESEGWKRTVEFAGALERIAPVVGSRVTARTALLFGWNEWWTAEDATHPTQSLRYLDEAHRYHRALRRRGVTVDIVRPGDHLVDYDFVIVPTLFAVSDGTIATIEAAAMAGATVVITPFSGIADADGAVRLGGYPGAFREALGIVIEEFRPLLDGREVVLSDGGTGRIWTDRVRVIDAHTIVSFDSGPSAGAPAITRRPRGSGAMWYVGTVLDDGALDRLLTRLLTEAGISTLEVGADVDVVVRRRGEDEFGFVVNHGTSALVVHGFGVDLLTGAEVNETPVPPGGSIVVHGGISRLERLDVSTISS